MRRVRDHCLVIVKYLDFILMVLLEVVLDGFFEHQVVLDVVYFHVLPLTSISLGVGFTLPFEQYLWVSIFLISTVENIVFKVVLNTF